MKYTLFLSFIFLIFTCNKEDKECVTIQEKSEENGTYYFYFHLNYSSNFQSGPSVGIGGINSGVGSGKVSMETYNNHEIGDQYCF